ncbi:MAG: pentapeptide repeat-containing protein [Actinomycetota bacterium]|nr:pentapeptide repeat-containing protein [Actinomycetota bacterium]
MAARSQSDEPQATTFVEANLRGARFVRSDLSGAVMRAFDVAGADIDAPWLLEGGNVLRVNGIDVVPFVEAELNRRFPGRADRRAADPDGLRSAWAMLEVRAGRIAMVREFLATVTLDELAVVRKNPWAPEYPESTLSCLHTILEEEWEHHRYAVRDLEAIQADRSSS